MDNQCFIWGMPILGFLICCVRSHPTPNNSIGWDLSTASPLKGHYMSTLFDCKGVCLSINMALTPFFVFAG